MSYLPMETLRQVVALRKESVDRNKYVVQCRKVMGVALRKESVDRNTTLPVFYAFSKMSLSARRAWIEINALACLAGLERSLSARRAWIEMRVLDGSKSSIEGRSPQGERG